MTDTRRTRVLVVDDSAFARKVLRQALEAQPSIEVVGIAADGLEALEKIAVLAPDVVTLDLMMPQLDGVGVLRELSGLNAAPRVIVVSFSSGESELVVEALQLGAVDFLQKPTALATDRLYELSDELVAKVHAAAGARRTLLSSSPPSVRAVERPMTSRDILVVGTSTGGPQALTRLVAALPADFPVPIAIALHIPAEYTASLAQRLDQGSPLHVVEASNGLELKPGLVALAKGGMDLQVQRHGRALIARLTPHSAATSLYVPSVDVLFQSAAQACGARTLAAVLTGMGNDGLAGARAVVAAGGTVLTEAESSCVIYGMPRCVREEGLSVEAAALDDLPAALMRRLA